MKLTHQRRAIHERGDTFFPLAVQRGGVEVAARRLAVKGAENAIFVRKALQRRLLKLRLWRGIESIPSIETVPPVKVADKEGTTWIPWIAGRESVKRRPRPPQCCPAEAAMEVIGGKWRVGIVHHLKDGPLRFNELRKRLPQITQKMLTQQLRHLQRYGLLERTQLNSITPHVEYSLTPIGSKLVPLLATISAWADKHMPTLEAAAVRHDAAQRRADPATARSN